MDTGNQGGKIVRALTHAIDGRFRTQQTGTPRKAQLAAPELASIRRIDVEVGQTKRRLRRLDGHAAQLDRFGTRGDAVQGVRPQRIDVRFDQAGFGQGCAQRIAQGRKKPLASR